MRIIAWRARFWCVALVSLICARVTSRPIHFFLDTTKRCAVFWEWMDVVRGTDYSTRFAWILGRRGVRAAYKPLPSGVERCSSGWTRDSRVKGFPNVAEVFGSLTACGAEAWTSGGIRQQSFCDSWPFLPLRGEWLFCSPRKLRTRLQKGIWDQATISLRALRAPRRIRRGSSGGNPIVLVLSPRPPLLPQVLWW
jgi:hypothetical protein